MDSPQKRGLPDFLNVPAAAIVTAIEDNHRSIGFSAIGDEFYATDTHGVYPEGSIPGPYLKPFADDKAAVENYYRLERTNRIFGPRN